MTWDAFYRNKLAQRNRAGGRCEYCGKPGPTESHHLFQPDHPYLQVRWNIAQLCARCHLSESRAMQVDLARRRIEEYGTEHIEQWAANAPFKLPITLPAHYWEAAAEIFDMGQNFRRKYGQQ